jgi:hypothetical protein
MLTASDSPWLGAHALILRSPSVRVLEPLLLEYGELLPLACKEADLAIFNATRVVDALDEGSSSLSRFSGGRIMRATRYALVAEAIAGVEIFRIPNLRVSPTFLSERIVQTWHSAGLRGLEFRRIWPA